MSKNIPLDMKLYKKIKNIARNKFDVWPSVYASVWVVKEYKRRGGKYKGKRDNINSGLSRWFREEWINVCKLPKKVKCGRPKSDIKNWKQQYPYCRPTYKINYKTPKTYSEFSKRELKNLCKIKRKNPMKILRRKSPQRKSRRRK